MKNNIRKIRIEKGLSIGELAQLANISKVYIYHLENGTRTNPSYEIMRSIAKSLSKEITEVFIFEKI